MRLGSGSTFSDDIAIDLGTANTLVHVVGRGIVIDEPSVVAIQTTAGQRKVLSVGQRAKMMIGRTPDSIETIRPMRDGVIADFVATEEMLRQFIKRTKTLMGFRRPRILICVPAGATPVERRAVYETAYSAGARKVYMVEEPVAAAIGSELPVDDPAGCMVVDIGGGTTDIAVLSLGGVILARSLRCAGNSLDAAIVRYVRRKHQLLIGEANAERIKVEAGSASSEVNGHGTEVHIRGRDLRMARLKSIVLGSEHIAEALDQPIDDIGEFIERALEDLPPEVASDICDRGIVLTGGGALLTDLDEELGQRVGVKFLIPKMPTHCVVSGSAKLLQDLSRYEHLLIRS
ncbi:MAG: rod shape-determining protein [Alphaproteobacteria bacterium]|nr:rod shape-determining protein [Alphaproteobacteria bacterium]